MPASEARIAAARANGARSRGPASPEGKSRSRANAYKHGMAGAGVVLPPDESAEVARRSTAMRAEMAPRTEMGRFLVDRLAELTVRVDRCSREERAAVALRVPRAAEAFDEGRIAEVERLISRIADEPATFARRLRSMPEGVDRMIAGLLDLRDELGAGRWGPEQGDRVAHLTGLRWREAPVTRARALSEAIGGEFRHLRPGDGESLSAPDRAAWAGARMFELIDAEVEALLAHRATLDLAAIEDDRAGAAARASFDPSREEILARRYEAAAERGVYRALKELRRVEAEARAAEVAPVEAPATPEAGESLGSFGAGAPRPIEPAAPLPRPVSPRAPEPRPAPAPMAPTGAGWSEVAVMVGRRTA